MSSTVEDTMAGAVSIKAERGSMFTRAATALALNPGLSSAAEFARDAWPDTPGVSLALRAAVGATDTGPSGGALVAPGTNEFLGLVSSRTIVGRLDRLRKVPLQSSPAIATGGATFGWLGEGAPTPVGRLTWVAAALPPLKFGGIAVATRDLLALGTPASEATFRQVLVDAAVEFMDEAFISAAAGVPNAAPGGILEGVVGTPSAGPATDIPALLEDFASLDGVSIILSERNLIGLAMAMPGAIINGKLAGVVPLIASSAAEDNVIAVHAPSVLYGDDGRMELDHAHQPSLQMDTAPDDPTVASSVMVSLWQHNLAAVKLLRWANWSVARAGAVQVITGASY
jgi:hypothetical protein